MNEDDLRRSLRDEADRTKVSDDSWHRLQSRLTMRSAERSPARSMLRPAIAIAVFAALLGGVLFAVREEPSQVPTVGKAMTDLPRRILAATTDGWLAKLDTRTGKEIGRYSAKLAPGTPVAVSPDGRSAFFTGGDGKRCRTHRVETRPIEPGPGSATVASGASRPAISPDGRYLAFYVCTESDRPVELALIDLVTGGAQGFPARGPSFGRRLAFTADSRHLVVELVSSRARPGARDRLYLFDIQKAQTFPGVPFGLAPHAFLGPLGTTGSFVGRLPKRADPATGRLGDTIMRMTPMDPVKPNVVSAGRLFFSAKVVRQLASDPSGRHLLFVADHTLYRWSRDDEKPTKIRDGIVAAAWIPDPPRHAEPTIAVVRQSSGELEILDSQSGATRQQLGPSVDASQISTTHDGTSLLVGVNTSGPCGTDGAPRIDRVDRANRTQTRFGNGLFPASNGSDLVAYEVACDGISLGITDLKSGDQSRSNPLPGRPRESSDDLLTVHPIAWSPNGRELLYAVEARGSGSGYYVGRLSARRPVLEARTRLPLDTTTTRWVTFVDDGHVATVRWRRGRTEVRVIPIGARRHSSTAKELLIGIRGRFTRFAVDASGRRFLLLRDDGVLVTWARGESKARPVATGIGAGAWLPQLSSPRLSSP